MVVVGRPARSDNGRRDLTDIAIDCFARFGYKGTSIDRIGFKFDPEAGLLPILADNTLWVEFFETYDDPCCDPDALWISGTISIQYDTPAPPPGPVPAANQWGLIALTLLLLASGAWWSVRRRNSASPLAS